MNMREGSLKSEAQSHHQHPRNTTNAESSGLGATWGKEWEMR